MSDKKDDNVEYFPGKTGFYKKGPTDFKISFGNLEDLVEEAEEKATKEEGGKRLKAVPEPDDPPDESA